MSGVSVGARIGGTSPSDRAYSSGDGNTTPNLEPSTSGPGSTTPNLDASASGPGSTTPNVDGSSSGRGSSTPNWEGSSSGRGGTSPADSSGYYDSDPYESYERSRHVSAAASGPDGLTTGLMIGGGVAAATGVGVGGHAIWARTHVAERQQRLADANTSLAGANQHETAMRSALKADRVHPPTGTSADDALAWARSRFASGAGSAITHEGTTADLDISRWGSPTGSSGEALSGARSLSDGNAGGVVRAGEWHIPVRFAQDLDALEKSRRVSYTETVWEHHSGPNPANGGKYEYHYGPHQVTKYRTEHYLDEFTRFRSSHDGLNAAFNDDFANLRHVGTRPERAVEEAVEGVAQATDEVGDATRSLGYATGKSGIVRNVAIGVALLGAGALAVGLVRNAQD